MPDVTTMNPELLPSVVQEAQAQPKKKARRYTPSELAISALRRAESELASALQRFTSPSEETLALFASVDVAMDALHIHLYSHARAEHRHLANGQS